MATIDWHVRRTDGISLVELLVESDLDEWVRIESRIHPVWPPRRYGVPESGWDETGYEGVVPEDGRLLLGFASPESTDGPPAELVSQEPVEAPVDGSSVTGDDLDLSAESADPRRNARRLVRALGTATPPGDVVPIPATGSVDSVSATGSVDSVSATESVDSVSAAESDASVPATESATFVSAGEFDASLPATESDASLDEALDGIERRLCTAENLAVVDGVEEAREAIETVGGIGPVRDLHTRVVEDRQALHAARSRQRDLVERLERVEIPLATLERLA